MGSDLLGSPPLACGRGCRRQWISEKQLTALAQFYSTLRLSLEEDGVGPTWISPSRLRKRVPGAVDLGEATDGPCTVLLDSPPLARGRWGRTYLDLPLSLAEEGAGGSGSRRSN